AGARAPLPHLLVPELVDWPNLEPPQLGRPPLAAEHSRRMQLPEHDVRHRILHGPRRFRLRPRHQAFPVGRLQSSQQRLELVVLALCPVYDKFFCMSHGLLLSAAMDFSRRRFLVHLGQFAALGGTGLLAACQGNPPPVTVTSAPAATTASTTKPAVAPGASASPAAPPAASPQPAAAPAAKPAAAPPAA